MEAAGVSVGEVVEATAGRLQADHPAALDAELLGCELKQELARRNGGAWASVASDPHPPLAAWPKAGGLDLALDDEHGRAFAIVDVRCGEDELRTSGRGAGHGALAVAEDQAAVAFQIAAAPADVWERRDRGARMFESRFWSADALLDHCAEDFEDENGGGPAALPFDWRVVELREAPFQVGGERWMLRATQIGAAGEQTASVAEALERGGGGDALRLEGLEVSGGSGAGLQFAVSWTGGGLNLERRIWGFEEHERRQRESSSRVEPDDAAWQTFWRRVDELDVWEWAANYEPPMRVSDGYGWQVYLAGAGRRCESTGYMAFPTSQRSGPRATWDVFLLAMDGLAGRVRLS